MASKSQKPQFAAGQIWFLQEPRLGNSEHGHYALIASIQKSASIATINFIATEKSFHQDFRIESTAAGFGTTGLKHTCHLLRREIQNVELTILQRGRYSGTLTGELKSDIEEWWGEPI